MPFDPNKFKAFKEKKSGGFDPSKFEAFKANKAQVQAPSSEPQQFDPFSVEGRSDTTPGTLFPEPSTSGPVPDFFKGLTTNEPVESFAGQVGRSGPAVIGGTIGAGAGAGIASAGTAALGGGAAESARQALVNFTASVTGKEPTSPTGVIENVSLSALAEGAGQGVGLGLSAGFKAAKPALKKFGAEMIRVMNGVKTKYGEAALDGVLSSAPSLGEAGAIFNALFEKAGVKGLAKSQREATGKMLLNPGHWTNLAEEAFEETLKPKPDPQKLVWGSEAIAKLKELARFGNPEQQANAAALGETKGLIDDAIEPLIPGYREARTKYFGAKTKEAFSTILPQNKNATPNVLRAQAAGYGALGALGGTVNPLFALPIMGASPLITGGAIRGAQFGAKVAKPFIKPGLRAGAETFQDRFRSLQGDR